jgi:hypothetical protein
MAEPSRTATESTAPLRPLVPPLCTAALNWCGALTCNTTATDLCSLRAVPRPKAQVSGNWKLPITATLIVLFGLLQIADGIVTFLGLDQDLVDEVNPVLNASAKYFGLGASIAVLKLAGLAFIAFLFFDRHKMKSRWITAALASAVGFYSWVVANNVTLVLTA